MVSVARRFNDAFACRRERVMIDVLMLPALPGRREMIEHIRTRGMPRI